MPSAAEPAINRASYQNTTEFDIGVEYCTVQRYSAFVWLREAAAQWVAGNCATSPRRWCAGTSQKGGGPTTPWVTWWPKAWAQCPTRRSPCIRRSGLGAERSVTSTVMPGG